MRRTLYDVEHEDYRRSVATFLTKEVVPHYEAWSEGGRVPRELFTALGELGALGLGGAEEFGGSGISDFRYNCILIEEAQALGVMPAVLGASLQADVVLPYLTDLTDDEQRRRWLPGVVSGETITAIAMTEPGTGSDLSGIRTRARRDGDDYVVDGAKTFITNGVNADLVVVAVRTGDHPHRGLSLLAVERGMPGFDRGRSLRKMGQHAQDTAELAFDGVRVPAANLIGEERAGFAGLQHNLARERVSIAVSAVAGARAALDLTVDHVRSRSLFGKPVGALQHTRFVLAELATEIDLGTQYVDRCVTELNAGTLDPVDAAKAKWWTTELHSRAVDAGVQLHGGYGYMHEYPIARAWADARVARVYGGTTEIMKEIVGRSLGLAGTTPSTTRPPEEN
jgi:alkylation response protein AidB-like acyl-CoA dehydrogenase